MFRLPRPVVGSSAGLGTTGAGEIVGTDGEGATVIVTGSLSSTVAVAGTAAVGATTETTGAVAKGITVAVFIAVFVSTAAGGEEGEFTDELPPMMCLLFLCYKND
jgi:hypothetical protein